MLVVLESRLQQVFMSVPLYAEGLIFTLTYLCLRFLWHEHLSLVLMILMLVKSFNSLFHIVAQQISVLVQSPITANSNASQEVHLKFVHAHHATNPCARLPLFGYTREVENSLFVENDGPCRPTTLAIARSLAA